jgi:hypothetical protein
MPAGLELDVETDLGRTGIPGVEDDELDSLQRRPGGRGAGLRPAVGDKPGQGNRKEKR